MRLKWKYRLWSVLVRQGAYRRGTDHIWRFVGCGVAVRAGWQSRVANGVLLIGVVVAVLAAGIALAFIAVEVGWWVGGPSSW